MATRQVVAGPSNLSRISKVARCCLCTCVSQRASAWGPSLSVNRLGLPFHPATSSRRSFATFARSHASTSGHSGGFPPSRDAGDKRDDALKFRSAASPARDVRRGEWSWDSELDSDFDLPFESNNTPSPVPRYTPRTGARLVDPKTFTRSSWQRGRESLSVEPRISNGATRASSFGAANGSKGRSEGLRRPDTSTTEGSYPRTVDEGNRWIKGIGGPHTRTTGGDSSRVSNPGDRRTEAPGRPGTRSPEGSYPRTLDEGYRRTEGIGRPDIRTPEGNPPGMSNERFKRSEGVGRLLASLTPGNRSGTQDWRERGIRAGGKARALPGEKVVKPDPSELDLAKRHPSRHIGRQPNISNAPELSPIPGISTRKIVHLAPLEIDEIFDKIFDNSVQTRKVTMPGFSITAVPPHAAAQHIKFKLPLERRGQMKPPRQESMVVGVFAMASIKRTSKLAVERKRCQRKLKTAMDLIVNRGAGLPVHENGWDLVSQGWGYLITAEALSWSMPMEQMIKDLVAGLQRINRKMTERPPNRLPGYRRVAPMGGFQGKVRH